MFFRLLLAFTITPAVELYLLIRLGEWMGAAETVALIVFTGIVGAHLARREGFSVLRKLQEESRRGFPSGDRMVEGVLVLAGGLLLLTPGVITDLLGFSLIIPFTRRWLAPRLKARLLQSVNVQTVGLGGGLGGGGAPGRPPPAAPSAPPATSGGHFDHPVV